MVDNNAKYPPPFSLRLTFEERARLLDLAGGAPLGAYIRERLLTDVVSARRARKSPVRDGEALAKVLACLGQSRLSSNLNQLAKAVNTGSLPVTPETEQSLVAACEEVRQMRQALIAALGLQAGPS